MAEQQPGSRDTAWNEWFSWLISSLLSLVRSVRVALMARVIVLGALGLICMTLGWRAISKAFPASDNDAMSRWQSKSGQWLWEQPGFAATRAPRTAHDLFFVAAEDVPEAPVSLWLHLTSPFLEMFRGELQPRDFLQLLLCGIWALLVWGLAGGAITRIAALKLTRDEAPDFLSAIKYALGKILSYSAAPMIAILGAGVFWVQLMLLGLLMRIDLLAMLAGLAWPFVLMLGLLMAILLLGALVGWPLMWATVSVEGTDAFDALSRSYAYTYQRPWRMLWYVLFATFLAAVSMFIVKLFALSAIALGDWSVDWGLDRATMNAVVHPASAPLDGVDPNPLPAIDVPTIDETGNGPLFPAPDEGTEELADPPLPANSNALPFTLRVARRAIELWKTLVTALAAGYQAGFLWVSAVAIYLLLRRDIDGVEMNEVFTEQNEDFGIPPLADDGVTGVPEVSTSEPAQRGDGNP
jgi:hypothetical protein